ncbi:MAG TPA: flagellar protein FlgN [Gammaproteobacteria bacterium]|nr:flagellar protein FlgN [Gammaproteobacteria bacterium]
MSNGPTRLRALLDQEAACAAELLSALATERDALSGATPERLEEAAAAKAGHLARLEALETDRAALLRQCGEDPAQPGSMERLLARLDDPAGQLADRWREILDGVARCQSENRVNGAIAELSKRYVQNALNVLQGAPPEPETYLPSGAAATSTVARPLGKA